MRLFIILLCACAAKAAPVVAPLTLDSEETHFASVKQLTFGGENAEAYWSWSSDQLIMQTHGDERSCDRIVRMDRAGKQTLVSSGQGATTCSFFLPGDDEVIFASTHLGGEACPPKPDHSQGYVWPLYPSYDIFKAKPDGSGMTRLTETPGYDAEGTVCKDGTIVFTSVRDGDLELYRMDRDGKNVKRLTHTPGYDGGAFFSADCTKIVWRASRPKPGKEMDDYQRLLGQNLVRPSKLELYVANADGSDAQQITYLDAASFAPFFHPNGKRILFSSNYGDPKGREFDIFAINTDGTGLERITQTKGFDGFPMFSPDGKTLAFSSNRATAPGKGDTNVFIAEWKDDTVKTIERAEDRLKTDVSWLAHPDRGGRGTGDKGLDDSAKYVEDRFRAIPNVHVERQTFPVTTAIDTTFLSVKVGGKMVEATALALSASGKVTGKLVFADYGLTFKNVKDAVVLVRRFVPEGVDPQEGDLRKKAWAAREAGAKALLVMDLPDVPKDKMPPEAGAPPMSPESYADSGIPVLLLKRDETLLKQKTAEVDVQLRPVQTQVANIVARMGVGSDAIVIGAHYDHLGMGGRNSLAPDQHAPHVGADDNASGTAALFEIAAQLAKEQLKHEIILVAFSAEESGVLGSSFYVRNLGAKKITAMLNMDMIGRLRDNKVQVLGSASADEWPALITAACDKIDCQFSGNGYGPSDQMPFFAAGIPVLHFFTGAHADYHKPTDTADKINYAGEAKIASVVAQMARSIDKLTYKAGPAAMPTNGDRRSFNASLGTVPDYAGPPNGERGVLLSGVRPGSAAEKGGLQRGDILKKLGTHTVGSVEDLMFALNAHKPGETVRALFTREGKEQSVEVTFEERKAR